MIQTCLGNRVATVYPGSPKTKLCPLVVGNPLHGSSQRPATLFGRLDFQGIYIYIVQTTANMITPPKFNSSPLKNGGWKTILSYWEGNFSGAMLNFGRVIKTCQCPLHSDTL